MHKNVHKALWQHLWSAIKQPSSKVLPEIRFQFFNLVQADKSGKDVAAYAQLEMYKE